MREWDKKYEKLKYLRVKSSKLGINKKETKSIEKLKYLRVKNDNQNFCFHLNQVNRHDFYKIGYEILERN